MTQWAINFYLEFLGALGFQYLHVWARPPDPELGQNGYIFHNKAAKPRTAESLSQWYEACFKLGGWPIVVKKEVDNFKINLTVRFSYKKVKVFHFGQVM